MHGAQLWRSVCTRGKSTLMSTSASTIEKSSPKLAKSCVACRISKVRCETEGSENPTSGCLRCVRLGLHCVFEQSRRGKANKSGARACDVARLGPSVRSLLRSAVRGPDDATLLREQLDNTTKVDQDVLQFSASAFLPGCQQTMAMSIWTREGQMALLRHWLLVGVRSGSCGLLGNVLILAHSCSISLDTVSLQLGRPQEVEPLPRFLLEWMDHSHRLCCCRSQVQGTVSWQPNAAFVANVGDEQSVRAQLEAAHAGLFEEVDALICTAEIFLAAALHPDDQKELVGLNGRLWSTLAPAADGPAGARSAEAVNATSVRALLGPALTGSRAYVRCTLSGRTYVHADSRAVFTVFSLVPSTVLGPTFSLRAPWAVLPDVVRSTELSPQDPPTATSAATGAEGAEQLGYEALHEVGLTLSPEDASVFINSEWSGVEW